jgi:hypothetical protein
MRWIGVPHTGHGLPYRPCAAIPSRKAVTFSGNLSPVSAIKSSRHFVRTATVCACRLSICSGVSLLVSSIGDIFAAWRISSE